MIYVTTLNWHAGLNLEEQRFSILSLNDDQIIGLDQLFRFTYLPLREDKSFWSGFLVIAFFFSRKFTK